MKQRWEITEEEHVALNTICNEFYEDFSFAFATSLKKCPSPDLVELLYAKLMEHTSSPRYVEWDFATQIWKVDPPS